MKSFHLVFVMLLIVSTITMMPSIYAEDEDEDDEKEDNGLMQREQEQERDDDDESSIPLGSDTGNIILYGTILAIVASIGYTAFKILSSKRKPSTTLK